MLGEGAEIEVIAPDFNLARVVEFKHTSDGNHGALAVLLVGWQDLATS
jgi:hypothetical protein